MRILVRTSLLGLCALSSLYAADSYTWGNVRLDGGGFVSGVIASPAQKNLVYARTDVGGAYRWDESSARWIPLMDWVSETDQGIMGTEALAVDPSNPGKLYILGGTKYFSNGKTVILRSSDYGESFDTTDVSALFKAHGNAKGRQAGEKLAVDPKNGDIVYCGSRLNGLFKSVDGGKSWSLASSIGAGGSDIDNTVGISFVLFDSTSATVNGATGTLFIGVGSTSKNLYMSTDAGATFTEIPSGKEGPTSLMPLHASLGGGYLVVSYASGPGPDGANSGAIYKVKLSDKSWTDITPKDDKGSLLNLAYGGLSMDAQDPNHLLASTLGHYGGQWRHADLKEGWGDKIFATKDGGASWTLLNSYATPTAENANVIANGTSWLSGHALHWAGSAAIDPFDSKKAWVTSGNGIFRSDDIGAASPQWKFVAQGLEEAVPFEALSIPGGPLVTAIGDYDGSVYTDITLSPPLHSPQVGTTLSLGYAPLTGRVLRIGIQTTYPNGVETKKNMGFISDDKGSTWTALPSVPGIKGQSSLSADGKVMLHRPEQSSILYRSDDGGESWSTASGLDGQAQYAPVVADPVNASLFYVLDAQGNLLVSTDKGASFAKRGSVVDNSKSLYYNGTGKIRTVPGREGHLWAPLDKDEPWSKPDGYSHNGLAYSEDGGATFTRISQAKVDVCTAVGIGKAAPNASYETVFIWGKANGGPVGMYRSIDKGENWERINDDAHQFGGLGNARLVSGDMNTYGRVYMSSVGRGLIYGNIGAVVSPVKGSPMQNLGASLIAEGRRLSVSSPLGQDATLELLGANGRLLRSYTLPGGSVTLDLGDMHGFLLARLQARGQTLARQSLVLP